jgi:hypothetical protein
MRRSCPLQTGALYDYSITAVIVTVAGIQAVALAMFLAAVRPATQARVVRQ